MKPGDRIRSLQGPILVLGASGFVGANLARSAARAPRRRRRDHEPHARLAARGPARAQRARVRRARRAQRRPHARRGAAAHRLQLHRLRRVLVRDRRRADPAHEPHEHARAARAPGDAQHRRLHPRRQLVGVRRERGRARGARLPRRQQRVRRLQGRLRAPHPLLRQAARPALGQPAPLLGLRAARGSLAADAARSSSTACAASCRRSSTRTSRATSSTATTSSTRSSAAASELREDDYGDSFNVGTGRQTTIGELAEVARELYGIERAGDASRCRRGAGTSSDWYANSARARKVLGWEARTPLEDGLERMTSWYRGLADPERYRSSTKEVALDAEHSVTAVIACYQDGRGDPGHVPAADGDVRQARHRLRDHLRQRREPRRQRGGDPRDQRARPPRARHLALAQLRLAGGLPQRHGARDEERGRAARRRPAGSARADRGVRGAVEGGLRRRLRPPRHARDDVVHAARLPRLLLGLRPLLVPLDPARRRRLLAHGPPRRARDAAVRRARPLPARRARLRRLPPDGRRLRAARSACSARRRTTCGATSAGPRRASSRSATCR